MKSFRVIQGSNKDLNTFENDVSQAIEDGYEFAGELIVKTLPNNHKDEVLLLQPMSIEDHLEFESDDLDYEDDEELGLQS
jgi:hypothetical protein